MPHRQSLRSRLTAFGVAAALTLALTAGAAAESGGPSPAAEGRHCANVMDPVQRGDVASKIVKYGCFDSFADAAFWATDGSLRLPADLPPTALTQDILAANRMSGLLSIDYEDPNFDENPFGPTLSHWGNNAGCNGYSYFLPTMPSGWDNQVSSAQTYTYCNHNLHYEHTYYGGVSIDCTCATMGAMNDHTSSEKWWQ